MSESLIAVVRSPDYQTAKESALACIRAGFKSVEITFTLKDAATLAAEVKKAHPDIRLGVGTILSLEQMSQASDAEVDFLVSPHLDESLCAKAKENNLDYIPGGMSPSELHKIQQMGFKRQKLYPAERYDPEYVKGLKKLFPELQLVVSGGVDLSNAKAWLEAGAQSVGAGSSLFKKDWLEKADWKSLEAEANQWVELCA